MSTQDSALTTARTLLDTGRTGDAAGWYARVLESAPAHPEAAAGLARLRLATGDLRGAVLAAAPAAAQTPTAAPLLPLHRMIGLALYQAWLWEDAAPWLERAVNLEPWDRELADILALMAPRPGIAPEIYDPQLGRTLKRYPAREGNSYIYVVEITGTCNLRCPTCPVGNSPRGERPLGFMPLDLFERIIAKIKTESEARAPGLAPMINLFNWGEPLLHPELPRIIEILRAAGLRGHLSSNLNIRVGLEDVIKANPDDLKISISGFTQETYGRTHKHGDVALVKKNMRDIRTYMDRHGATTNVWVCHHLYRHNTGEMEELRKFAAELGFSYHPIHAFYMPLERLMDVIDGKPNPADEGIVSQLITPPAERLVGITDLRSGNYDCELRFNQTVINHDGAVALCCSVYDRDNMLGVNFLDEDFQSLEARKYTHSFCATCIGKNLHYTRSELFPAPSAAAQP